MPYQRKPQLRCTKCNKVLGIISPKNGTVEIKCRRCGLLNYFLDESTHQIIITDPKGKIMYVNNSMINFTGYQIHELIGNTPALWGNNMPENFYQKLWYTVLTKKQTFLGIVKNTKKSGEIYRAQLRVSPIINTQGDVEFLVGIETVI